MRQKESMKQLLVPIVITALLSFPVGYIVGSSLEDNDDTDMTTSETTKNDSDHEHAEGTDPHHSHDDDKTSHSDDMSHSHGDTHSRGSFDASDLASAPAITSLSVTKDAKSGWNLRLTTENFTFAPQSVNEAHVNNEGHAHVMVNGERIARIYSGDLHISDLPTGENTIMVTLNTNEHDEYQINGETISAMTIVTN